MHLQFSFDYLCDEIDALSANNDGIELIWLSLVDKMKHEEWKKKPTVQEKDSLGNDVEVIWKSWKDQGTHKIEVKMKLMMMMKRQMKLLQLRWCEERFALLSLQKQGGVHSSNAKKMTLIDDRYFLFIILFFQRIDVQAARPGR